ncbi:hypothetical protein HU200_006565 [Digitaria exilis]|uniref:Uncharacterized protein n=1 Tax=Digitaria exilis TaxID=1010633 RepID=A0A835FPD4_9POAL|nr:hypothetical protein HU200_006565 [Digitaria exilis]
MASTSKVVFACIMIFLVISSQADARRLMEATCKEQGACKGGTIAVEGDGSVTSKQEMVSLTSTKQPGEGMPMATTDARPTAPGNSPGIGNRGKVNN